jgi:ABC-type transporter Mla subunit MlaD
VKPVQIGNGAVAAELDLKLDKSAERSRSNSTMMIRPKSPLGLKYLQIVPGDSREGMEAGETIPLSAARPEPVDIDQFFSMFDEKTRTAIQRGQAGFGNALAGRGPQLNGAFGVLRTFLENSQPVLRTLVSPRTNFGGFWEALEDLSATVAPVAETQASMFVALDRTFAAFARVSRPYIQENDRQRATHPRRGDRRAADAAPLLPQRRPFLRRAQARRPRAGRNLADDQRALRAGIPALNRSPALFAQLTPTAEALLAFQGEPGVFNGLDLLIDTNNVPRSGDRLHRARADHLQLPQPCFHQPRRRLQRIERERQLARRDRLRAADRSEHGVDAVLRPGQRSGQQEPPSLQPLSENRRPRPGRGLRSRQ